MLKKPLVSIITPTYNHENYISECIESVLEQTYENWEMIIVDDGSTDSTKDIINGYAKKDKRIKTIFHDKNYGIFSLYKTYNEALELSRGDWIAILEGDDVWPTHRLQRNVEVINQNISNQVVLIHGQCGLIYSDLGLVAINKSSNIVAFENGEYNPLELFLLGINPIYAVTVLIKADVLKKIGGFVQKPVEIRAVDFPTYLRLASVGNFYYDSSILGFWRIHDKSVSFNNSEEMALSVEEVIRVFLRESSKDLLPQYLQMREYCIGKLAYLGTLRTCISRGEFEKAEDYLRKALECFKFISKRYKIPLSLKIKLQLFTIATRLRNKTLIKFLYDLKRKGVIDKVLCEYKPFFYKDIKI